MLKHKYKYLHWEIRRFWTFVEKKDPMLAHWAVYEEKGRGIRNATNSFPCFKSLHEFSLTPFGKTNSKVYKSITPELPKSYSTLKLISIK
jgi:hypothetical protein